MFDWVHVVFGGAPWHTKGKELVFRRSLGEQDGCSWIPVWVLGTLWSNFSGVCARPATSSHRICVGFQQQQTCMGIESTQINSALIAGNLMFENFRRAVGVLQTIHSKRRSFQVCIARGGQLNTERAWLAIFCSVQHMHATKYCRRKFQVLSTFQFTQLGFSEVGQVSGSMGCGAGGASTSRVLQGVVLSPRDARLNSPAVVYSGVVAGAALGQADAAPVCNLPPQVIGKIHSICNVGLW